MKKQTLSKLAAVIVTITLIAILLSQIEVGDVVDTLTGIEPTYLVVGFGLYALSYFFRALRFYILLNREVGIKDLFAIVCAHNLANNLLPLRTGELSFFYLVGKNHRIPIHKSIATLTIARIFDFISIGLIFFISVSLLSDVPEIITNIIWMISMSFLFTIIVLLVLIYNKNISTTLKKHLSGFGVIKFKPLNFLFIHLNKTIKSVSETPQNKKRMTFSLLLSITMWVLSFTMGYLLIIEMGIQLDIWSILVGFTFSVLISILPVHGVGGFGTMEGAWAIIFIALGTEKEIAISTGFAYHIIIIIFTTLIGIYGMLFLNLSIESKLSISFKKVMDHFF